MSYKIPRTLSTQHPDNVTIPFFANHSVLKGDDEIKEAFYAFSNLGVEEIMWDAEGKEADDFVIRKLITEYKSFFEKKRIGKDVFINIRVPNPQYEKAEAKILLETLESIPRSYDTAELFYGDGTYPPIFEVVVPMADGEIIKKIRDYYKNVVIGKEKSRFVEGYSLEQVSEKTGLSLQSIEDLARHISRGKRVSFWWTMGINQSYEGVRSAQAIINLALMTGNMGRPGTGANSITGQCNAMGSRIFSNTTNLLGGHDFTNQAHRKRVAGILKIDESVIPTKNSLAYNQMIDEIALGKIKGLWVIATNPAYSWIGQKELHQVLKNLEFLVVQDMFHTTETAQMADLILPAAAWGEKDGTFINSERRISTIRKIAKAPGEALADFHIFRLVAHYWGCEAMFKEWNTPQDVFEILKKISQGTPCDITGIRDYAMIDQSGGIQWPYPEGERLETHRRLFEDGQFFHIDRKARFLFEPSRSQPEEVSAEYPFVLLTGRGTSAQWHTQTRTGKSKILHKMYSKEIYVEINPQDACTLAIQDGQWVYVSSRRAEIKVRALVVPSVQPGHIFIPMHYGLTNQLTLPSFDPYSYQPSYKFSAARVSKKSYFFA